MRSPSFLLFVCLLCLTFSLPLSAQLALEIVSDSVAVTGLPPGGTAVLVGTARYGETYRQRHEVFRELLTDEDGDGRASFAPPEGLPIASLWVAVDDETGAWAIGTPEGYSAAVVELSPAALDGPAPDPSSGGGPPEVLDRLRLASEAIAQEWLELTVIRTAPGRSGETSAEPPAGPAGPAVWGDSIFEGGSGDEDGAADGALVASLPGLEGRLPAPDGGPGGEGGPPALAGLRPGDVLVMLAPLTAHVYLFQREPGPGGGNGSGNEGLGVELVPGGGFGAGREVSR